MTVVALSVTGHRGNVLLWKQLLSTCTSIGIWVLKNTTGHCPSIVLNKQCQLSSNRFFLRNENASPWHQTAQDSWGSRSLELVDEDIPSLPARVCPCFRCYWSVSSYIIVWSKTKADVQQGRSSFTLTATLRALIVLRPRDLIPLTTPHYALQVCAEHTPPPKAPTSYKDAAIPRIIVGIYRQSVDRPDRVVRGWSPDFTRY